MLKTNILDNVIRLIGFFPDIVDEKRSKVYCLVIDRGKFSVVYVALSQEEIETYLHRWNKISRLSLKDSVLRLILPIIDVRLFEDFLRKRFESYSSLCDSLSNEFTYNYSDKHWLIPQYEEQLQLALDLIDLKVQQYINVTEGIYYKQIGYFNFGKDAQPFCNLFENILLLKNLSKSIKEISLKREISIPEIQELISDTALYKSKFPVLNLFYRVMSYKHPVKFELVNWVRLTRIQYEEVKNSDENIMMDYLTVEDTENGFGLSPLKEFELSNSRIDAKKQGYYFEEKIQRSEVPIKQKYQFPFYDFDCSSIFVNQLLKEVRDEYNIATSNSDDSKIEFVALLKYIINELE